jgi:hypothetical protein
MTNIFYHRTTDASAKKILRKGFRDAVGTYGTGQMHQGVWLSNIPLDCSNGAKGDFLLQIELPEQVVAELADYEWIEDGKGYREWLVPAQLINNHAKITAVVEDEGEEEFDPEQFAEADEKLYQQIKTPKPPKNA